VGDVVAVLDGFAVEEAQGGAFEGLGERGGEGGERWGCREHGCMRRDGIAFLGYRVDESHSQAHRVQDVRSHQETYHTLIQRDIVAYNPPLYKTENRPSNSGILKQIVCCKLFVLVTRKVSFDDCLPRETKRFKLHHLHERAGSRSLEDGKLTRWRASRSASVTSTLTVGVLGAPFSSSPILSRSCVRTSGFSVSTWASAGLSSESRWMNCCLSAGFRAISSRNWATLAGAPGPPKPAPGTPPSGPPCCCWVTVEPGVDVDAGRDADEDMGTYLNVDADVVAGGDVDARPDPEDIGTYLNVDADVVAGGDVDARPDPEEDIGTYLNVDADVVAGGDVDARPDPDEDIGTYLNVDADVVAGGDVDARPDPDEDIGTYLNVGADVVIGADMDAAADADVAVGTDADEDMGTYLNVDADVVTGADVDADPDAGSNGGMVAGTDAEEDMGTYLNVDADVVTGADVDADPDAESNEGVVAGTDAEEDMGTYLNVDADVVAGGDSDVDAGRDPDSDMGTYLNVDADVTSGLGADAGSSAEEDIGTYLNVEVDVVSGSVAGTVDRVARKFSGSPSA